MVATSPDDSLEKLKGITAEFSAFCEAHGAVTEADTRAKVSDRILTEVCGWPELERLTRYAKRLKTAAPHAFTATPTAASVHQSVVSGQRPCESSRTR